MRNLWVSRQRINLCMHRVGPEEWRAGCQPRGQGLRGGPARARALLSRPGRQVGSTLLPAPVSRLPTLLGLGAPSPRVGPGCAALSPGRCPPPGAAGRTGGNRDTRHPRAARRPLPARPWAAPRQRGNNEARGARAARRGQRAKKKKN